MRRLIPVLAALAVVVPGFAEAPYQTDWASLSKRSVPKWLVDAKFGIYAHWGVYSVPAFATEWYGKWMYDSSNRLGIYEHHKTTWGPPVKFGYKDFIPMFKAEKFDPEGWADLVRESGAKYAGTAVIHHDGFALWHSKANRWNAGEMGPRRDLYGDLVKALRKRGIRIVATEHHMRTFGWFLPPNEAAREALRSAKADLFDPRYADFYWNEYTSTKEDFLKQWKAKLYEIIDNYRPDVLWFDGGDFTSPGVSEFVTATMAHYLNSAAARKTEVEVLNKFAGTKKFNFPREFGILTFEEGRDRPAEVDRPWVDDLRIGVGAWGYTEGMKAIPAGDMIRGFVDRVSRGGGLLVSLAPKASGEIPEDQKAVLRQIGAWLKINAEAIYGSRPWKVHAEGDPAKLIYSDRNGHRRWRFDACASEDIRFTRAGNALYAIALGWPSDGKLRVKTLSSSSPVRVATVELLGARSPVKWLQAADGLIVTMPSEKPGDYAYTLRITSRGPLD